MTKAERLDEAKRHLCAWMEAELQVAKGQEFSMGSRKLTMPDLPYIVERIGYWRREVSKLEGGGRRIFHVIPRDL